MARISPLTGIDWHPKEALGRHQSPTNNELRQLHHALLPGSLLSLYNMFLALELRQRLVEVAPQPPSPAGKLARGYWVSYIALA